MHDELLLAQRALQKESAAQSNERRRKEKRDLAVVIVSTAAGFFLTLFLRATFAGVVLFVGLLALAGYIGNLERMVGVRKIKIFALQAAIVVLGTGIEIAVLYPFWRAEQANALEGDLLGAEDGLLENGATPWVQIGDSKSVFIMASKEKVSPYFKPFPDAEFLVEGGKTAPLISTTVRDRFGNLVVKIKQNHWTVYPPYCSDKNYTKYALEVEDSSGHVLLQIRLVPGPPRVQVQGEWWSDEGRGLRIVMTQDGNQGLIAPLVPQDQKNDHLIQEIFKYPSRNHWKELVNEDLKPRSVI